jgi:hypothetical protein
MIRVELGSGNVDSGLFLLSMESLTSSLSSLKPVRRSSISLSLITNTIFAQSIFGLTLEKGRSGKIDTPQRVSREMLHSRRHLIEINNMLPQGTNVSLEPTARLPERTYPRTQELLNLFLQDLL